MERRNSNETTNRSSKIILQEGISKEDSNNKNARGIRKMECRSLL